MSNVACESAEINPEIRVLRARSSGGGVRWRASRPVLGVGVCRLCGNLMGQRMGKLEYGDESQECVVVCHEMVSMPSLDEVATPPSRQWPVARVTRAVGVARRGAPEVAGWAAALPSALGRSRGRPGPDQGRPRLRPHERSYFNNHNDSSHYNSGVVLLCGG